MYSELWVSRMYSAPEVTYYADTSLVPVVPRELYHYTFLVLWRSRKTARQAEFKIVTYNSTGWVYCNRERLGGFVHGWAELLPVQIT